jgi:hypothetical protein
VVVGEAIEVGVIGAAAVLAVAVVSVDLVAAARVVAAPEAVGSKRN